MARRRLVWLALAVALPLALILGGIWIADLPQRKARAELAASRPQRAKTWLTWSQQSGLGTAETEFLLARVARKFGKHAEFQIQLQRARQRGYSSAACDREAMLADAQAGRLAAAERQITSIFDGPPGESAEASEALANGYMLTSQIDRAEQMLRAWQADYPRHAQPHYMLGLIWRNLRSDERAENAFRTTLDIDSQHGGATLAIADLCLSQQRLDEAFDYFKLGEQFPEHRVAAFVGQARACRLRGKTDAARQLLESVLRLGASSRAEFELGQLELESGNYQAACERLESAQAQDPQSHQVREQLALALTAAGRNSEADSHFDFVERTEDARNRIRLLVFQVGVEPRDWEKRVEIARLSLAHGSTDEALVWLRSALEIDANCRPAHALFADYFEQRQTENRDFAQLARQHRRLSLDPE